ncbi:MAG: chemotaxis protein CheB [Gammaproteobacteria bacterium]
MNQVPEVPESAPKVVGIGASAGGLGALKQLFSHMPDNTGLAFVVVIHLSPEHPSHLADVLQPHASMPVLQVTEAVALEPNRIYVIPPGSNLSTIDSHLRLSEMEKQPRERAPIDHFFRTLAQTHGGRAIGIILSGSGSDGMFGIKEVRQQGGLTIVQDPNEAEFDSMPQNAIATQAIDLILPITDMPAHVLRFAHTRPRIEWLDEGKGVSEQESQVLQKIFAQLQARTGQDFSKYKRSTVLRRIRRRMQLHQCELLTDYLAKLRENAGEVRLLAEEFLITVTQFFRDTQTFEYLEKHVVPTLFEGRTSSDRLRVWSVGCATGEEAYSLAMLLLEHAAKIPDPPALQVFASDIHEPSLRLAREGIYSNAIVADLSPERLSRFFTQEDRGYRICTEVREIVVFATHNLLRDPPFSRMQLIVCRNVLIYLQRNAQRDVVDLLHYALDPDGQLLLGPSESIDHSGLFHAESKRHALYRRRNVPVLEPRLPVFLEAEHRPEQLQDKHHGRRAERPHSYGALHQKMVERYALPSVLVDHDYRIVHASEHAGRYLCVPGGEPSTNLLKLVREELRLELDAVLHTASKEGKDARSRLVAVPLEGQTRGVVLHVRPSQDPQLKGLSLVIFDEMEAAQVASEQTVSSDARARREAAELERTKERLQSVIEQYETTQEEMKASNEELQSSNEELRSTLEELETSKEELQSVNEELHTVNQENRHKVEELSQLTSDLNNLMAATEIATLFLDRQQRILRVTPRVAELFNVCSSDRGRPLGDFTHRLGYDELQQDAQRVLERLVPSEREVLSQQGEWYLARILPYRSDADRIEGVVITFIDITQRKKAELALRNSEESFRALVSASAQIVWTTDAQGQVVEDSPSWRAFTGQTYAQWRGLGGLDVVHPDDRGFVRDRWLQSVASEQPLEAEFRLQHVSGEWRWTEVRAVPLRDPQGKVRGWVGMNIDITDRKRAEENLREADRRKDEFLAMLGHELRNPLAPMRTAMELLRRLLPPDPQLQHIREMNERQVRHLTRLVDDLLDVSRIKSGRVTLQLEQVDIVDVVRDAVASYDSLLRARHQQLVVEQTHEPLPVKGDEVRLSQIVANLLDNAAKYTPDGGVIRLTTQRAGEEAVIAVADNGMGIAPDVLAHVFDAFRQGLRVPAHPESGLGLGLTLVQRLAQLHKGRVEARSGGPGQGSEFTVHLPLTSREAATEPQTVEQDSTPLNAPSRVLVVDDNRDAADSLALILKYAGHQVRQAYDAHSALEIAQTFQPQAVLLDIGLPDMDGYALARELRRQKGGARAVLIAVSGYAQDEDRARSASAGVDHHLAKPVNIDVLQAVLARPSDQAAY